MAKTAHSQRATAQPLIAVAATHSKRHEAAYHAAWRAIEALAPGETVRYHEGNLAADITRDAEVAGRAAAYRHAASELGKGTLAQRRIGFEWYQYLFRRSDR